MSVKVINGVGISTYSGNRFLDLSAMLPETKAAMPPVTHPDETKNGVEEWANWGTGNRLPIEMVEYIESTGILSGIIDHQARLAIGHGVKWAYTRDKVDGSKEIVEIADVPEIKDFMQWNNSFNHEFAWMKDQIGFANGVARFVLNDAKDKIVFFQRDDVTEMRYKKMNQAGVIDKIYLSAQWENIHAAKADGKILMDVPLLDFRAPLPDLIRRKKTLTRFAMTFRYPSWLKKYYSMPLWWANLKWVKIARSVPDMKAHMYENSMRPKYLITIYTGFWEKVFLTDNKDGVKTWQDYTEQEIQDKKNEVYDQIDKYLSGEENAGKAIFTDGEFDTVSGKEIKYITIEPIEDTTKEGGYLPDSAAANSEIAFSMRYNPSILGATMPSGPYTNSQGGSSVRESVAIQVISHEPERQNILAIYRLIRDFNKWNETYKKAGLNLEPFIPATILTTLDTGSGSGSTIPGAQPGNNNSNPSNGTDQNNS